MRHLIAFLAALVPAAAAAQTSFPMLTHVTPVAVQRGTTAEVVVECRTSSLAGAYQALVEGDGVTIEPAPPKDAPATLTALPLKVTVAAGARPGVREFRVACRHGVSSLGQLVVVDAPVVKEQPGNGTREKAQPVSVPVVVCGRVEAAESVDYYRFPAKAGRTVTFEVFCARLQDKIHDLQKHADPLVAVYDATGKELAAADDGFFADPVLAFTPPADGQYVLAVRDAKYDGDPRWAYAVTVTDGPYAAHAFPLGVNPGKTVKATPVGSAAGADWTLTASAAPGITTAPLRAGEAETNPVPVVVTPLSLVEEVEPNDGPKAATRITVPCGVNGRVGVRRDLDHYVFAGVKGKPVRLEVFARRFGTPLRSQLDAQLDVLGPGGAVLASNDDQAPGVKDSALVFTPPADGDYVVRVRDLNNKGGDGFVYLLECDHARPDFTIKCDPSKAMIGPGGRTAWYAQVTRANGFAGPVAVEVKGRPAGVTVNPLTIPANMTTGLLVVSAAEDAKVAAAAVTVVGTAEVAGADGKPARLERAAVAVEEIYFPGGGRGRFDAGMAAVAVTATSDIARMRASKDRVVLKPGEEVKIDVEVVRGPGFAGPVTLDVPLRHLTVVYASPLPPGVTMVDAKSKTLLGTGSAGHVVLKAAPDAAECTDVPVCVQAFVPINFVVKIGYATDVIWVSVKK